MNQRHLPNELQIFLNKKVDEYHQPFFIEADPICVPHSFSKPQDIEIAGFFAAIFSWGNRTTIIHKSKELMQLMGNEPHAFCLDHTEKDLQKLFSFKHRTFVTTDLLYFIEFFKHHYQRNASLESAFTKGLSPHDTTVEKGLIGFYEYFFSLPDVPYRTLKHIASPHKHSACKRINMYLRWMVRSNRGGVDFGLWKKIKPAQLVIPLDVHVIRVAQKFDLLRRKQPDWQAALELTETLRALDSKDPVKYDFALFGLGVLEKF